MCFKIGFKSLSSSFQGTAQSQKLQKCGIFLILSFSRQANRGGGGGAAAFPPGYATGHEANAPLHVN